MVEARAERGAATLPDVESRRTDDDRLMIRLQEGDRTAFDATAVALLVGVFSAVVLVGLRRSGGRIAEVLDTALMLPLGVSAVTVGFGYLVTMDALPGATAMMPPPTPLLPGRPTW